MPDTSRAATDIERTLRTRLAACYRVVDHLGWSEVIMNHITLRLPGPEHHFLINPYGLRYDEVTASNLVKIDTDGNKIGDTPHPVNPAGFVIHSAIHAARDDAHCVLHTHSTAGIAVATIASSPGIAGRQPSSLIAALASATSREGSPARRAVRRTASVLPVTRSTAATSASTEWPSPVPRLSVMLAPPSSSRRRASTCAAARSAT